MKNGMLISHHRIMLLLATLFALLSMVPVVEPPFMRLALPMAFLVISALPRTIWNKGTRFILFAVLVLFILIQAGGFKDGIGTSLLIAVMLVKHVEMKTVRDASTMSLFNTLAPFIGFLQEQDPLILLAGVISVMFTTCLLQMLHIQPIRHRNFFYAWVYHVKILGRTSLMVLPLAFAVYAVAPRFDNPLWGNYKRGSHGGVKDEMNVAQWDEMFTDLSTAFRVRFEGKPPPRKDMYFRGLTMWTFDGQKWITNPQVASAVRQSPEPRGDRLSTTYRYTMSYEIRDRRLYTLDYPTSIPSGSIRYTDDTFLAQGGRLPKKPIALTSARALPSSLKEAERESALQLPEGNPKIKAWALEHRQKFKTDREFAVFVENYLRTEYLYNLAPMPVGKDAVDDFFFTTREGFCAHFSSAFTVIMRAAGLPARVVNGYFASEVSQLGDFYRVRQADAHAWSEVWIEDRWVRFEPTSSVGSSTVRDGKDWISRFLNMTYSAVDWLRDAWERYVLYYDRSAQEKTVEMIKKSFSKEGASGIFKALKGRFGILVAIVAITWLLAGLYRYFRRRGKKRTWPRDVEKILEKMGAGSPSRDWVQRASKLSEKLPPSVARSLMDNITALHKAMYDPLAKKDAPPLRSLKNLHRIYRQHRRLFYK